MKTRNPITHSCTLLVIIFLIASCKKPSTDFTIDRSDYSAGDVITVTNQTKNIETYLWRVQYNSTTVESSSDPNPSIRLNPCAVDGNYTLILNGKTKRSASSVTTRDFLVKTIRGNLRIYCSTLKANDSPIEVMADNKIIAQLYPFSHLTLKIAVGVRYLTASNGKTITLNIQEGQYHDWDLGQ